MARRSIPLDASSSLPRNLRARHLHRLLCQQLVALLRAPVRHPQRVGGVPLALPAMALGLLPQASLAVEDDAATAASLSVELPEPTAATRASS